MPLAFATPGIISIGSTLTIQTRDIGIRDVVTGEYVNTATGYALLKDEDDTILGMAVLEHREGTDGHYFGYIPASVTATLDECKKYLVVVTMTIGDLVDVTQQTHVARKQGEV